MWTSFQDYRTFCTHVSVGRFSLTFTIKSFLYRVKIASRLVVERNNSLTTLETFLRLLKMKWNWPYFRTLEKRYSFITVTGFGNTFIFIAIVVKRTKAFKQWDFAIQHFAEAFSHLTLQPWSQMEVGVPYIEKIL